MYIKLIKVYEVFISESKRSATVPLDRMRRRGTALRYEAGIKGELSKLKLKEISDIALPLRVAGLQRHELRIGCSLSACCS